MKITATTPYDDVLARLSPGPQSMRGFDEDYPDIVAYIIRCTYKIWEQKQTGLIASHYADDAIIHTPSGDVVRHAGCDGKHCPTIIAFSRSQAFPRRCHLDRQ